MLNLGDYTTAETIPVPLTTYDSGGGSVTITGLAVTDIEIYKAGSVTQRASDAGYTLLDTDGIDFDTTTGLHGFSVDLSDNTDAGFYANGATYWIVVNAITVDGQTVVVCYVFSIGRTNVAQISGDATAADNLELACDNYSVTRGLTGTALPPAAADAAGGVPISDDGGLDLDAKLAETNEVTAARMATLTDWINGGRLDLLLDALQADLDNGTDGLGALKALIDTVNTDLSNGTDGLGALKALVDTAQSDLDKVTGPDGAIVATDGISAASLASAAVDKIRDGILPTQNVAFNNIPVNFVSSVDHVTPVTGATGTGVTRSIDGGAFGAGTGTLSEVGNGAYSYDASAADMNGGVIQFRFTATGGTPAAPDDFFLTIVTGGGV